MRVHEQKKWDSLPDDIKKIFLKVGHDELPVMYDYYLRARRNAMAYDELFLKRGIEVFRPTEKELVKIEGLSKGDWEATISFLEKRKLPGRKVLDKWGKLNWFYENFYAVTPLRPESNTPPRWKRSRYIPASIFTLPFSRVDVTFYQKNPSPGLPNDAPIGRTEEVADIRKERRLCTIGRRIFL